MCMTAAAAELEFDHVWIVVTRDAPERAALEHAGLTISPNVNRNDGQGTASVSAEFFQRLHRIDVAGSDRVGCARRRARRGEI